MTFDAWLRSAVAVSPACVPALLNRSSTLPDIDLKLLADLPSAVPSAVVLVFTAPVRSSTLPPACLSVEPAPFALPSTCATRLAELDSRFCALWVSEPNDLSMSALSVSVPENSLTLPVNCVSWFFAAGLSIWLASCEAISSAVPVSVSENISLICALTVSAPCPVIFGASAFFFSLL